MENLKQELELLYELQEYDVKIYNFKEKINKIPFEVEKKKRILGLQNKKAEIDVRKENFVRLISLKKEKESLLDLKEKKINKHSIELNVVKSNDIYKALLLEIEKTKEYKSILEDEILDLMDKADKEYTAIKTDESELKKLEQKVKDEMDKLESSTKELEEEIKRIEKEREKQKLKVNKAILAKYERLREGLRGQGISLIEGESCGSCGIFLRPQLINQAQKYHELVFCDNCSRILFKK
jgi:predicted  nucleic acid-binding Zn-ribbon protein